MKSERNNHPWLLACNARVLASKIAVQKAPCICGARKLKRQLGPLSVDAAIFFLAIGRLRAIRFLAMRRVICRPIRRLRGLRGGHDGRILARTFRRSLNGSVRSRRSYRIRGNRSGRSCRALGPNGLRGLRQAVQEPAHHRVAVFSLQLGIARLARLQIT